MRLNLVLVNLLRSLSKVVIYKYVRVVVAYNDDLELLKVHLISAGANRIMEDESGARSFNICKNLIEMSNGFI